VSDSGSSGSSDDDEDTWRSDALRRAQQTVSNRDGKLLTPAQAASVLEYEDVPRSFWMSDITSAARRPLELTSSEELPASADIVPYDSLRAFNSGGVRGWGVCSMEPIRRGQVVSEACGRCLTEEQFAALTDKRYVFGFDDEMLSQKRAAEDEVRYLDLHEYGNITRLVNDEQLAPNLEGLYWPPLSEASARLPRRFFLVARRTIPPLTELTWDYGDLYERHWRAGDSDDGSCSEATDDDIEWTEINWAQCDECNKWRKLPCGPTYCAEALPDIWVCRMNAATHTNTCEEAEDEMAQDEVYEGEGEDEVAERSGDDDDDDDDDDEDKDPGAALDPEDEEYLEGSKRKRGRPHDGKSRQATQPQRPASRRRTTKRRKVSASSSDSESEASAPAPAADGASCGAVAAVSTEPAVVPQPSVPLTTQSWIEKLKAKKAAGS